MNLPIGNSPASAALARDINGLLEQVGGRGIEGLENLDPDHLALLRGGLEKFRDQFLGTGANQLLGPLAQGEIQRTMRDLAKIASAGFAQGGKVDALGPGFLSQGEQLAMQAGLAGRKAGAEQQLSNVQNRLRDARAELDGLSGNARIAKQAEIRALEGQEKHLKTAIQGIEAEQHAIRDGVITRNESQGLQALDQALQGSQAAVSGMARTASMMKDVASAGLDGFNPFSPLGALAGNGCNFNPLAGNAVADGVQRALSGVSRGGCCGGAKPAGASDSCSTGNPELDALAATGGGGAFFEDRVFAIMCKVVKDMQKQIEERLNKLQQQAKQAEEGGGGGGGMLGGMFGGGGGGGGLLGGIMGGGGGGMLGGIMGMVGNMVMPGVGGIIGGMAGNVLGGAMGGGGGGGGGGPLGALGGGGGGGAGGAGGAGGDGGGSESRNIEFEKIKMDIQKLSQMQQAMSNVLNTFDELAKSAIRHIKAG